MRNVTPANETDGEILPSGNDLDYGKWKTLNRIRAGVAQCKYDLCKWSMGKSDLYECGEVQNDKHLSVLCRLAAIRANLPEKWTPQSRNF